MVLAVEGHRFGIARSKMIGIAGVGMICLWRVIPVGEDARWTRGSRVISCFTWVVFNGTWHRGKLKEIRCQGFGKATNQEWFIWSLVWGRDWKRGDWVTFAGFLGRTNRGIISGPRGIGAVLSPPTPDNLPFFP